MKNIKTLTKTLTSLVLAIAVGVLPAFATDASVDAASDSAPVSEVKKFTPAVDGVIDPEYLDSFNIEHEWPEERNPDNYFASGKFEFPDLKDENGKSMYDENGKNLYGETAYGWDCKASSYFLWDDDYLYITVDVTDDDYGCIDDEHYAYVGKKSKQDCVWLDIGAGDEWVSVVVTRDGKYIFRVGQNADGEPKESLCELNTWAEILEGTKDARSYFAAAETESGYILEIALKASDGAKAELLRDGASFDYGLIVYDAAENSRYISQDEFYPDAQYRPEDTSELKDIMRHIACYGGDPQNRDLTLTLSDEAPVTPDVPDVPDVPDILDVPDVPDVLDVLALDIHDVSGDGTVDSKDLTRLMKHLAGEEVELASADINGDGATDTKDLTRLMKHIAG